MISEIPADLVKLSSERGYRIIDEINSGSFGVVYLAADWKGEVVALKCINRHALIDLEKNQEHKAIKTAILEKQTAILYKVQGSPSILRCFEHFESGKWKVLVLEYCQGGTLYDLIQFEAKLPQLRAIKILAQLIFGFATLHRNNIVHRDLKTENILIKDGKCKIADFGTAMEISSLSQIARGTVIGTRSTMAPEVMFGEEYGIQADMWSLGVIFFEMITGLLPFKGSVSQKQVEKVHESIGGLKISDESKMFMKSVFEIDPKQRLQWKILYCMHADKSGVFSHLDHKQIPDDPSPPQPLSPKPPSNPNPTSHHPDPKDDPGFKTQLQKTTAMRLKFLQDFDFLQKINSQLNTTFDKIQSIKSEKEFQKRLNHFLYLVYSQLLKIFRDWKTEMPTIEYLFKQFLIIPRYKQLEKDFLEREQIIGQYFKRSGMLDKFMNLFNKIVPSSYLSSNEVKSMINKYVPYKCTPEEHARQVDISLCKLIGVTYILKSNGIQQKLIQLQHFISNVYLRYIKQRN